jgi:hypothetical protein
MPTRYLLAIAAILLTLVCSAFFAGWDILPWDDSAIAEFEQLVESEIRIGTMDLKNLGTRTASP